MPLIIEYGTGVEDANSYIDLADARELASMRGISLAVDDAELSEQLVTAADRITSYEEQFTGQRTTGVQGLSYPRVNSFRYCQPYPSDSIPKELKLAQVTLADYINSGFDVWAQPAVEGITREKVGPIETEYAEVVATNVDNPYFAQIESILKPLFAPASYNFIVSR